MGHYATNAPEKVLTWTISSLGHLSHFAGREPKQYSTCQACAYRTFCCFFEQTMGVDGKRARDVTRSSDTSMIFDFSVNPLASSVFHQGGLSVFCLHA